MFTVSIQHRGDDNPTEYKVYEQEEMDSKSKKYVYWKEAREGDWALSDDGYCAEVIKRTKYPNDRGAHTVYLRLPWGYFMWNPKYPTQKFNVKGRVTPHTLKGRTYFSGLKKQEKMKNLAMCYAQTMNKDLAIDLALGSLTDQQHISWKRRMKTEVFRNMVREELQKLLNEHGYTADWTMELFGKAIDLAKDKKDVSNIMRAVENLQDMHGMKDKFLTKTTTSIEAISTKKMLDEIGEEENKLIAMKVVEDASEPDNK